MTGERQWPAVAIGVMILGFQRAVFSNEAGIGSARQSPTRRCAPTSPPPRVTVALLEPFIDTVVICTLTALVILHHGSGTTRAVTVNGVQGVEHHVEPPSSSSYWLVHRSRLSIIAGVLFAFSTMISWSYYGLKGWTYLFGEGMNGQTVYKLIFCAFVALGCIVQLGPILDISDALVFLICVPNILGLYFLAPIVKRELDSYLARIESGEIKKYKNL